MDKVSDIKHYLKNNNEVKEEAKNKLEIFKNNSSNEAENIDCFAGTAFRNIDKCLFRVKRTNDTEEQFFLSNAIYEPVSETIKDNGQDEERFFKIKAILEGKELPAADIPADKFCAMNWLIPTWGLAVRTATGQNTLAYIRDSIQVQSRHIETYHVYTHTGYRQIDGKWAFMHNGGAIGAEGVTVELHGRLDKYSFPEGDSTESAKTALKFINVAPKEITLPLFSIAHLSVLNEFLRQSGIEPAFALFLLGPSGTMKSTLAALTLCFFGNFDSRTLPASFKDTANSLEKQGFILKDVLTVIDDYHPTGSKAEAAKMESIAQAVTRSYGDRTGRGRMDSNTTLKRGYAPRGNVIITGEDLPNIGQSGIARHLTVEIKRGDIDKGKLTELQNNSEKLALSMRGFIEWIIPKIPELKGYLKEQFIKLRQAAFRDGQHGRLPEAVAHLQTAMIVSMSYFQEIGCITADEAKNLIDESWRVLIELSENQSKRIQEDRPTAKFINALKELLSTNSCYTLNVNDSNHTTGTGFIGYNDRDFLYLYPEVTFREVARFYQSQGEAFPVGKNTLFKHLETEKIIDIEVIDGRIYRTKQKMIGSKKDRYLWIYRNYLTS